MLGGGRPGGRGEGTGPGVEVWPATMPGMGEAGFMTMVGFCCCRKLRTWSWGGPWGTRPIPWGRTGRGATMDGGSGCCSGGC